MAPPVLTWQDVVAWQTVMEMPLLPWEARTMVMLGASRASIQAKTAAKKKPGPSKGRGR